MEVILLENIENLGSVGDKVSVKAGFARNYLVPQGKAKMATAENLAEFEARRAELEKAAAEAKATAESRKQAIEAMGVIEITARVGSEGKLFGSVGPVDIVDALANVQVEVERAEIRMPEGPIQELGEFPIGVHLHAEVDVEVLVRVVGEDGETAPVTETVEEPAAE